MSTSPPPDLAGGSVIEALGYSGPDGSLPCAIKLDVFEGPLDLLLHLIRENEVDVHDIPIAAIAEQYVEYLTVMRELNAIPAVMAAPPGVLSTLDLPLVTGPVRGGIWRGVLPSTVEAL